MCRAMRWLAAFLVVAAVSWTSCHSSNGSDCDPCGDDWVVNADIWGAPEGDLFVAGYRGHQGLLRRFDGSAWIPIYEGAVSFRSMWGTSAQDFYVLDLTAALLHFSSGGWEVTALAGGIDAGVPIAYAEALWGTDDDDLFVAGGGGMILHFDGVTWQPMPTPTTAALKGLWGSAHDDVLAVGDLGTILRFDGMAWSLIPSPTTADLTAVWGASADNVFIAGVVTSEVSHVILHFDGSNVTVMHEGDKALLGLHGAGPDCVYAVGAKRGSGGVSDGVFRFDGTRWHEGSAGVSQFLWDVWANPDGSYIAVGPDDTIARRSGR